MKNAMTRANEARMLTTKEVGELLGLTEKTVRTKVARGELPQPHRVPTAPGGHGRLLFRPSDITRYLDRLPKASA